MTRRAAITATLICLLTACAPPVSGMAGTAGGAACTEQAARFPALIGQDARAVAAQLRGLPGIAFIRIGGRHTPMTMDFRRDRATILEEGGRVVRITCG